MALTAAQLDALAQAPLSASNGAGSATARSADDILKLTAAAGAATGMSGTNENGGPKSGWGRLRVARHRPEGAVGGGTTTT